MTIAKTYLNRAASTDALKDAQDAIRVEIHVREARKLGLAVVEVKTQHPDRLDGEQIMEDARFATLCVSGGEDAMVSWVQVLANLGVAFESYEFNIPPDAVSDQYPEEMWGEVFTDRIDSPAVNVGASVDHSFEHGLPVPTPPAPRTVNVQVGNLMDVEVTLLNLKGDPVAYRRVQEALEIAGFARDTIDGAIETMQAIGKQLRGEAEAAQLVAQN